MEILNATEARANLYNIIDMTAQNNQPIYIKGKRNSAVLISATDWEAINETLYLTSISGMAESIKEGLNTPLDECLDNIDL